MAPDGMRRPAAGRTRPAGVRAARRVLAASLVLAVAGSASAVGLSGHTSRPAAAGTLPGAATSRTPAPPVTSGTPAAPATATAPAGATPGARRLDAPLPAAAVARLAALTPVFLITSAKVLPATLATRIAALPGAHVLSLATGTLRLAGRPAAALAAQPAGLRAFTPSPTAASDPLWASVARGDAVETYEGADAAAGTLGHDITVTDAAQPIALRLGARAGFGLARTDLVMSAARGAQLGLTAGTGLLIGTTRPASAAGLAREVSALLAGSPASAVPLGAAAAQTSTAEAASSSYAPRAGAPVSWLTLFQQAATTCPGLPWQVLASIGQIESDDGRDAGTSSAGAVGPMQFLPSTFAAVAVDGDHDGKVSPYDPYDAVYTAARLLCRDGAGNPATLPGAVFAYNHAGWYVAEVLALAQQY